jgi:hypothetical protein
MIQTLRTASIATDAPALATLHDMYRDTFVEFLDRWLYRKTDESDFSLSALNRHFIFHGLGPESFYRPEDVHRLILALDLLVDFLAVRQKVFYTFLPDDGQDAIFDKRRNYYYALAIGEISVASCRRWERDMLKDHPRYKAPDHDPNLAESIARAQQIVQFLQTINKPPTGTAGQN